MNEFAQGGKRTTENLFAAISEELGTTAVRWFVGNNAPDRLRRLGRPEHLGVGPKGGDVMVEVVLKLVALGVAEVKNGVDVPTHPPFWNGLHAGAVAAGAECKIESPVGQLFREQVTKNRGARQAIETMTVCKYKHRACHCQSYNTNPRTAGDRMQTSIKNSFKFALSSLCLAGLGAACREPVVPALSTPPIPAQKSPARQRDTSLRPAVPLEIQSDSLVDLATLRQVLASPPVAESKSDAPYVTSLALAATARGEARGLSPLGPVGHASLAELSYVARDFELSPGDCVMAIAHGGLGVMEVDGFLLLTAVVGSEASATPWVLAQDSRGGPIAVVGANSGCYAFTGAAAAAARMVVIARKGAGEVVFGLFKASSTALPYP